MTTHTISINLNISLWDLANSFIFLMLIFDRQGKVENIQAFKELY